MILSSYEPKGNKQIGDMYKAREEVLSKRNLILYHLVKSHYDWMNEYIYPTDRTIIEIGAGMGVAKEGGFITNPNLQITDVEKWPWIDRYLDALNMDMPDDSVDVFILHAALHHFASPYKFLKDATKKLKSGGRILFLESYSSFGHRFGQFLLDLEGFNENVDVFNPNVVCNNINNPWSANVSTPKLMFQDKTRFENEFEDLRLELFQPTDFMLFLLSGGVNWRVWKLNFTEKTIARLKKLDKFLIKLWPSMFALSCQIVLVKR